MNIKIISMFICLVGIASLIYSLPGYASAINSENSNNNATNPYATLNQTPNMIAAGGPIPPNYTLAQQEAACAAAQDNSGWYQTLMPAEHHDSERTELYPCAQFPGSYTGPNDVFAYPSSDLYYNPFSMATRDITEMYLYGGGNGEAVPWSPAYVSKIELGSLDEQWRTYLGNFNITNDFSLSGAVYVLPDGNFSCYLRSQII